MKYIVFTVVLVASITASLATVVLHDKKKEEQLNTVSVIVPDNKIESCLYEARVEYYNTLRESGSTEKYGRGVDLAVTDIDAWKAAEDIKQDRLKKCWREL